MIKYSDFPLHNTFFFSGIVHISVPLFLQQTGKIQYQSKVHNIGKPREIWILHLLPVDYDISPLTTVKF